jgi:uncharacterized phiE125 gp8 family phage protein
MSLTLVTGPAAVPISLAEVKAQCRLEDNAEDALLMAYVRSAVDYVEQHSGLKLITQTWSYTLDWFPTWRYRYPADNYIRLPLSPVQSITSISYLDATTGDPQTWASTDYVLRGDRIILAPNAQWPTVWCGQDAVTVTFVVGYGASWNDVPESLRQAIGMLAAYWYGQREAAQVDPDARVFDVPFSVRQILEPYRVWAV